MKEAETKFIKVAFIGDSGVGKTSLIKSFLGEDVKGTKSTIAIDNYVLTKNGVKVVLWDFAGQKWLVEVLMNFIRGAKLIVLVFDLSDPKTLTNILSYWVPNIKEHADEDAFIILVGNKKDKKIIPDELVVKVVNKLKEQINLQLFIQTSALLHENISNLFNAIFEIVKMIASVKQIKSEVM
ncbi:MAG: Rab family GTPase [Candidatus Njordarchaeia archaeon]